MKLLTLNTQKAYHLKFNDFILEVLKEGTYDFILLQEVVRPVINIIRKIPSEYEILNPIDLYIEDNTHVCILYKKEFVLKKQLFVSFAHLEPVLPKYGWGFLGGIFIVHNKTMCVGSVHLHPGLRKKMRVYEMNLMKQKIINEANGYPIIFGGDFNFGLPGEILGSEKIFAPEFFRITKNIGATLNSIYTEKTSTGMAHVANILAKLGIAIKLKTDQVYIDNQTIKNTKITTKLLPDRVSDHLGIEIIITDI